MGSDYEVASRILHDIDAEIARSRPGPYADGLAAAGAIARAHTAGLARTRHGASGSGGGNGPRDDRDPPPSDPQPNGGGGRVIEAQYEIVPPHQKERAPAALTTATEDGKTAP